MAEYFHEFTFNSLYFRFIQMFNGQQTWAKFQL